MGRGGRSTAGAYRTGNARIRMSWRNGWKRIGQEDGETQRKKVTMAVMLIHGRNDWERPVLTY